MVAAGEEQQSAVDTDGQASFYYVETVGDSIVIGNEYDGNARVPEIHSLYALAADNARWLM